MIFLSKVRFPAKLPMTWIEQRKTWLTVKRRQDQDMALVNKFITQPSWAGQPLFNIQNGARTRQAAGVHGLAVQYARDRPMKIFLYCEICGVLEQITRKRKNSSERKVRQEKEQRKTRITVLVGDKVMGVCNQPDHTEQWEVISDFSHCLFTSGRPVRLPVTATTERAGQPLHCPDGSSTRLPAWRTGYYHTLQVTIK